MGGIARCASVVCKCPDSEGLFTANRDLRLRLQLQLRLRLQGYSKFRQSRSCQNLHVKAGSAFLSLHLLNFIISILIIELGLCSQRPHFSKLVACLEL